MRYNSITIICSLCILFSFLILSVSAQRRRVSSDLGSAISIEARLNMINKMLLCILQQQENIYSPELIRFANAKYNNVNEDILKENLTKYIRKKEDQELIYECQKFNYSRPVSKLNQKFNNITYNDFSLGRKSNFRKLVNKINRRRRG